LSKELAGLLPDVALVLPQERNSAQRRFWSASSVIVGQPAFDDLAVALFFIAVSAAACFMPAQSDTWWQLRAGEEIWRTHAPLLHDTFSHTVAGAYWPNHEWLSQALFYALYRIGGLRLLTAFCAALTAASWILIWHLTPGARLRRIVLFSLAVVPASIAWSLRPHILTMFLVALTLWLLSRRRYGPLPVVFLVWANLHGAVLLGVILLIAGIAAESLREDGQARRLLLFGCVSVLMITCTPLGLSFWTDIGASLIRIRTYRVLEWRAPPLDVALLSCWVLSFALIALIVRSRAWRHRALRGQVTIWAPLLLLPLALGSVRNVPPLMLTIVPAVAALLETSSRYVRTVAQREHPRVNAAVLGTALVAAASVVICGWTVEISRLQWHPLPRAAIEAVQSCPERLYNRYDEGGYLIWFAKARRVYLDGRLDPYPTSFVLEQMRLETSGDYEPTFRRYGIHCAFIPVDSVLKRRLAADGWSASYTGAIWAVMSDSVVAVSAPLSREQDRVE